MNASSAVRALGRYWPANGDAVASLPFPRIGSPSAGATAPSLRSVLLPEWASHAGVDGGLLVPAHAVVPGEGEEWRRTDWLHAAEWFITCAAERAVEADRGPIHSYSTRLPGWDSRIWDRAWANRIALFLRRWASHAMGRDEETLLGALPDAEILVTHDVDAIARTASLRLKQSVFHAFNSARNLVRGNVRRSFEKAWKSIRFLLGRDDVWQFDKIMAMEEARGIRSHFFFYAGGNSLRRHPLRQLIDPAYDVLADRLRSVFARLRSGGWTIGLHQSFDAWKDAEAMRRERMALERAAEVKADSCRQHWLRFSFADTWRAQSDAGFTLDTTLGFNDRCGFRNGAALRWRPVDGSVLESVPLVIMDSHLYDYRELEPDQRRAEMARWIEEVRAVRGQASVVWHQQVMGSDYGWADGYSELLDILRT